MIERRTVFCDCRGIWAGFTEEVTFQLGLGD